MQEISHTTRKPNGGKENTLMSDSIDNRTDFRIRRFLLSMQEI